MASGARPELEFVGGQPLYAEGWPCSAEEKHARQTSRKQSWVKVQQAWTSLGLAGPVG